MSNVIGMKPSPGCMCYQLLTKVCLVLLALPIVCGVISIFTLRLSLRVFFYKRKLSRFYPCRCSTEHDRSSIRSGSKISAQFEYWSGDAPWSIGTEIISAPGPEVGRNFLLTSNIGAVTLRRASARSTAAPAIEVGRKFLLTSKVGAVMLWRASAWSITALGPEVGRKFLLTSSVEAVMFRGASAQCVTAPVFGVRRKFPQAAISTLQRKSELDFLCFRESFDINPLSSSSSILLALSQPHPGFEAGLLHITAPARRSTRQ